MPSERHSFLAISATVINEKLYQGLATQADRNGSFIHGFTYSGHPVCAAVALETLKIYEERDILGHVRTISPQFLAGVRRFADHPLVGEVRAIGKRQRRFVRADRDQGGSADDAEDLGRPRRQESHRFLESEDALLCQRVGFDDRWAAERRLT